MSIISTVDPTLPGGMFLQGYGRETRYRAHRLADESTTIGDALIRGSLEVAAALTGSTPTPDAFALTHADNRYRHSALERASFELQTGVPIRGEPMWLYRYEVAPGQYVMQTQQLWRRNARILPPAPPATAYIPPS